MLLTFEATSVSSGEANDDEILGVCFDTAPQNQNGEERRTPFVLIMQNFEFPGAATVEWHDGRNYGSGADITSVTLGRERISIRLGRATRIDVAFRIADDDFVQLSTYLKRIVPNSYSTNKNG